MVLFRHNVHDGEHVVQILGLSEKEAQALAAQGKANVSTAKAGKNVPAIVASNVFTYFNAIFLLLSILLIAVGSWKNLTFLPVVIANMIIGIVQQLRAKSIIDRLAVLDKSEYTVIRDGNEVLLPSDQLVLGDVVCLESGQQVPADAVVVHGSAEANESLLTGEADAIGKGKGDELMSGSFLTSGKLYARLSRVGADSYAAQLTAKAKSAKARKSEMVSGIEAIVRTAGVLIIPVGALLYFQAINSNGASQQEAVTSMVGAVIGMIPEGLYLLVTIALALSAMRLAQKMVMLHDMRSIETLARVDVLCVDKTGTITSSEMTLREAFAASGAQVSPESEMLEMLASYLHTVPDNNETMTALRNAYPRVMPLEARKVTPFDSERKHSEVTIEDGVLRLGAPEFVLDDKQLEVCREAIDHRMEEGMRVLAFARFDRDGQITGLVLLALCNELREGARETFAGFAAQGVTLKVISGDNPVTVSKIAQQAGIENAERFVDAQLLETPEQIAEAAEAYTVFGRVKPEQKRLLVEALRTHGHKVAMTGDGVNDILAMKEADCSIAMGEGSDAARQAAQVVLLDSDFSHMHQIVSEGRRDINNITRSATLFLYKNIFSLLLATFTIFGSFVYPLTPNQVSLISMFNIGLPAFLLAFEPNEERQEGSFVMEVLLKSLPAALTSFFAIAAMMMFADLFGISHDDVATASTYLLSVVGFLILTDITHPLNKYRVAVFAICIVGLIVGAGVFYQLFDITSLSLKSLVLCVVFAIAEIGMLQEFSLLLGWLRTKVALKRSQP